MDEIMNIVRNGKVSDVMLKDYPRIDKDQTIIEALRLMRKYRVDRVVVTEDSIPRGIMTKKDLVNKLLQERTRLVSFSALHVSSFASFGLVKIGENVNLIEAARLMNSKGISSLAVVDAQKNVIGLLRKQELVSLLTILKGVKVGPLMGPLPYIARFGDRILHVRKQMMENGVYVAPVVDTSGRVVGVISIDDIADAIIDFYNTIPEKYRKEKKTQMFVEDYYNKRDSITYANEELSKAIEKMLDNNLRGLVVLEDNEPIGLLTLDNIVKTIASLL